MTMQARVLKKTQGASRPQPGFSQQNAHEKGQTTREIEEEPPPDRRS